MDAERGVGYLGCSHMRWLANLDRGCSDFRHDSRSSSTLSGHSTETETQAETVCSNGEAKSSIETNRTLSVPLREFAFGRWHPLTNLQLPA
jgi:hypothetical protein